MGLLEGQRAVVTGGGSGIGRATCRRMAEEGAQVAVFDLNGESAEAVADEIGGIAFGVDVGDPDALREAVDAAAAALGGLSIIYNNAGTAAFNKLHEMDLAEWDRVLRVNLTGVWAGHPRRGAAPAGRRRRLHRQHGIHQRDEAGRGGEPLCGQQGGRGRTDGVGCPGVRADHPGQRRVAGDDPDGHDRADVRVHAQPDGALREGHAGGPDRRARGHRRRRRVPLLGPGPLRQRAEHRRRRRADAPRFGRRRHLRPRVPGESRPRPRRHSAGRPAVVQAFGSKSARYTMVVMVSRATSSIGCPTNSRR